MKNTSVTTNEFKISIKISNAEISNDFILHNLARKIQQIYFDSYQDSDSDGSIDELFKDGEVKLSKSDKKIARDITYFFIHEKYINSYKWNKDKQSVKLKSFSIKPGSLILTFVLLVVTAVSNYGGVRETIDYIVEDTEKAFKFYLGEEYNLDTLIENRLGQSDLDSEEDNKYLASSVRNVSKISLGLKISQMLFIIIGIIMIYYLSTIVL